MDHIRGLILWWFPNLARKRADSRTFLALRLGLIMPPSGDSLCRQVSGVRSWDMSWELIGGRGGYRYRRGHSTGLAAHASG